jgi:hypothetical protein
MSNIAYLHSLKIVVKPYLTLRIETCLYILQLMSMIAYFIDTDLMVAFTFFTDPLIYRYSII